MTAHLTCQELVELVTAYLDDSMDEITRRRFEEHLALCPGCKNYLDQVRTTTYALRSLEPEALDPEFRGRLLEAFRQWR